MMGGIHSRLGRELPVQLGGEGEDLPFGSSSIWRYNDSISVVKVLADITQHRRFCIEAKVHSR